MKPVAQPSLPGDIRIVDLFAGPGGLDVAARWLGIPVVGVEWDKDACETREEARLETEAGDVRSFGPADFPRCNVLAGGPPCQTYTVAGAGAGRRALDQVLTFVKRMAAGEDVRSQLDKLDDDRTGLVLEPLRWTLEAARLGRPYEAIVLEQVPAVLPVWEAYAEALESLGYKAKCDVLYTEQYGVPQTRRRAILVARRDGDPELPRPTHRRYRKNGKTPEHEVGLLPWETMATALGDQESFVVISNYGTGGDPKARGRRRSDEPAATVTGKVSRNRVLTKDGVRRFTSEEAGRLQTFPRDYPWSGKAVAQQIGNAIPPRLAVHVLAALFGITDRIGEDFFKARVDGRWSDLDTSDAGAYAAAV